MNLFLFLLLLLCFTFFLKKNFILFCSSIFSFLPCTLLFYVFFFNALFCLFRFELEVRARATLSTWSSPGWDGARKGPQWRTSLAPAGSASASGTMSATRTCLSPSRCVLILGHSGVINGEERNRIHTRHRPCRNKIKKNYVRVSYDIPGTSYVAGWDFCQKKNKTKHVLLK